jgi:hypothetical protein
MTPEMSEEAKLKAKYGGALPRQLLTKKLMTKVKIGFLLFFKLTIFHLFQPKYFDSGDYNVAKAQGKLAASKPDPTIKQNNNKEVTTPIVPETVTGHEIPTPETLMPRKLSCAATLTPTSAQ